MTRAINGSLLGLSREDLDWVERKIRFVTARYAKTGERNVPVRVEVDGWGRLVGLQAVEVWDGPQAIRAQFEHHPRCIPGIGCKIATGAPMRDGTEYNTTPRDSTSPEPEPIAAPAVASLTPKQIAALIAKAKAAIKKGANRAAIIKRLRGAGIETKDI
jgi:hypothetical protein